MVARYAFNESSVFGCFLDASKAFDRVNHAALSQKLLKRNLSPVILRTLLYWYSEQKVMVRWNNSNSEKFPVSNGVRQDGVLLLFYSRFDLLEELERPVPLESTFCWRHLLCR